MKAPKPNNAPDDWQDPKWWGEVLTVKIKTKAEAKRIVRLCRGGRHFEAWKPWFNNYKTEAGRIRQQDFERAQDILSGVADKDPGGLGFFFNDG